MNKEIRQILKNQSSIMKFLNFGFPELKTDGILSIGIGARLDETSDLLNPKKPDPTIREQTDKSMNRVIKAGQDCPRCGVIGVRQKELQYHNSGRCIPRSKKVKVEK